jgi:hypothetical protein
MTMTVALMTTTIRQNMITTTMMIRQNIVKTTIPWYREQHPEGSWRKISHATGLQQQRTARTTPTEFTFCQELRCRSGVVILQKEGTELGAQVPSSRPSGKQECSRRPKKKDEETTSKKLHRRFETNKTRRVSLSTAAGSRIPTATGHEDELETVLTTEDETTMSIEEAQSREIACGFNVRRVLV